MGSVMGGISKGANFVGGGVAKAGHWGYSKYQDTDHYKNVTD